MPFLEFISHNTNTVCVCVCVLKQSFVSGKEPEKGMGHRDYTIHPDCHSW